MKVISGIFFFLLVFIAVGIAMHFAIYSKPGIFVWSLEENQEGATQLVRTTMVLEPAADGVDAGQATAAVAQSDGKNDKGKSAPSGNAEAKGKEKKKAEPPADPNLHVLYNGEDLGEWQKTQFGGEGDVFVNETGGLEFGFGAIMTGVHWGGDVPATSNYELSLDAMKLDGTDFFIALTFPVKESHATFVVGGWGGGVVGISSVDDLNASENETMNIEGFEKEVWYKIKVRVTDDKLEAWIDEDQKVDLELEDRKISLLPGDIELSVPIGIASFMTRAQYRNIEWRNLPADGE